MSIHRRRMPLMALTLVALVVGVWGGLVRLGWGLPVARPAWPAFHGPLMVGGFLGTLISLERAVALDVPGYLLVPAVSGLGALALVAGAHGPALWLLTAGSVGLVLLSAAIVRRQTAPFTLLMALGAVAWTVGNGLWMVGAPVSSAVLWWSGFLVLTIAGERLELNRVLRPPPRVWQAFWVAVGLYVLGLGGTLWHPAVGVRLAGTGLVALAIWFGRYDIARYTVRQRGLPRFIALCLLAGYVWLGVAGVIGMATRPMAGPLYDAMLHALFLGFVFSMIFGHAPLVFPGVTGVPLAYSSAFYGHLGLLHASLLMRVVGDVSGLITWRQAGGLLNALAILLFLANTGRAAFIARRTTPLRPGGRGAAGPA
ncbi:MAG: hypothetical protein Q9O62_02460 [Ardenticatenia bacterium]|nr:hypothetical protein [Ardenticatenia bacterium]